MSYSVGKHFEDIQDQIISILTIKNKFYGDTNLLDYGIFGVLVRINDKLGRIKNILNEHLKKYYLEGNKEINNVNSSTMEEYEIIKDQLIDIQGYAINVLRLMETGKMTYFGNNFFLNNDNTDNKNTKEENEEDIFDKNSTFTVVSKK